MNSADGCVFCRSEFLLNRLLPSLSSEKLQDEINRLGYMLFREGSVRRLNPSLFAVKSEDHRGWHLIEAKDGKWTCDCNPDNADQNPAPCPHVDAALLSSATNRVQSDEPCEEGEGKPMRCRYCGSPDISKVGFRYNARGISRRYICNECRRKFSIAYAEPQAVPGAPSGTLWLLSQVAMLVSKLNDLLRELDDKITSRKGNDLSHGPDTHNPLRS